MPQVTMTVNGKSVSEAVPGHTLLVDFIRQNLGLTGTHVGCDTSQCGACVVHVNGDSVKACTLLATQADGAEVTTIEGLAQGDNLHPMQAAFRDTHGLLAKNPNPSEDDIRDWLKGNICRCTGYHNIVKAIQSVAVQGEARDAAA